MPIRAFVSQDITQLQKTLTLLEQALLNGSTNELRVSGILVTTGDVTQKDMELRYKQCRYELYLRAQALADTDQNKVAYVAQFTNPYREIVMKVHSRSSVGVFGYPLPAPLVPPTQ